MRCDPMKVQEVEDEIFHSANVRLLVLRADLIHPIISGNKWWKLKYNLEEAKRQGKKTLLTFGGAFSNHILAVACAGKENSFDTIGIIRGEEHIPLNPVLQYASDAGMKLIYIDRLAYRQKSDLHFLAELEKKFGDFYLLPEGGSNELAVKGCAEMLEDVNVDFDHLCCCCGTGATLAGLALSLKKEQKTFGFSVLKGASFLDDEVSHLMRSVDPGADISGVKIMHDYHFGGYAKSTRVLLNFIHDFEKKTDLPVEPVYTGKMFYGIFDLVGKNFFAPGSTILAVHTGGVSTIINYKL